ncbi:phosphoadenylyl-sulfate reductase [Bacillus sp. FJAT-27445]|uniref:phosphoadenylyl-sulfate reductase n=1 Tax=Bacillus sp. FJAT-27445 TaxID=1679166 RepID=UPI0007431DFC|nr:phosphoadenylyl-sulfate reductase [Bacillus sp. FJAT-27445]
MRNALTYETWEEGKVSEILENHQDTVDVLKWAYREYGDEIVYACSFGAEGIVMLDLISKINKEAAVLFLDTGLHFAETYELIEKVRANYPGFKVMMVQPDLTLEEQAAHHGEELWRCNPNLCCQIRKVEPLARELGKVKAWISGLRREQSETRKHVQYINKDDNFKNIKICPLIHWKWEDIWNYIKLNNLPYNPLHDRQYPSIGCRPCTQSVNGEGDMRAGRWANTQKTECGLHKARGG